MNCNCYFMLKIIHVEGCTFFHFIIDHINTSLKSIKTASFQMYFKRLQNVLSQKPLEDFYVLFK